MNFECCMQGVPIVLSSGSKGSEHASKNKTGQHAPRTQEGQPRRRAASIVVAPANGPNGSGILRTAVKDSQLCIAPLAVEIACIDL